ncbi:MAG: hypothetical protein HZB51_22425 [Chloroflexi bacterium]|nr:hypothetical protein [Chloroflexota bacterium]
MPDANTFNVAAYTTEFRWTGQGSIPVHRRLSDFINDENSSALVLNHAIPTMWDDHALSELPTTECIALPKRNLLFIVNKSELPLPPDSKLERIPKDRFPVILYIPPFSLTGNVSLPRNADWIHLASSSNQSFFPITSVSVWHIKLRTKLETNANLVLVNWKWLIAMEPKR